MQAAILWRKAWADISNLYLERAGANARVDHRSHAERSLDEPPTIHEGVTARALEKKGILSDRCEINRQIRADNALLRELKAQVKKLMDAAKNTIPVLAEKLETLLQNMIIFRYQLLHIAKGKSRLLSQIDTLQSDLTRYAQLIRQIKGKSKERKMLLAEKKNTPVLHVVKHRELSQRIAELTEDIEELKSENATLLRVLDCDDTAMADFKKDLASKKKKLMELEQHEQKNTSELDNALRQYTKLNEQAAEVDAGVLMDVKLALCLEKERAAASRVQTAYGGQYGPLLMHDSKQDIAELLGEKEEIQSVRERSMKEQNQLWIQHQKEFKQPRR